MKKIKATYPNKTLTLLENDYAYGAGAGHFTVPSSSKNYRDSMDRLVPIPKNTVYLNDDEDGWQGCREEFHESFDGDIKTRKKIVFAHLKGEGPRVARFLAAAENRLKIKKPSKVFGFKNKNTVSLIKMSPWWVENTPRLHLLTILLRCGRTYTGNFDKALFSHDYIKATREAVKRFFEGYTHFVTTYKKQYSWQADGDFYGWTSFFDETGEHNDDTCSYRTLQERWAQMYKTKPRKKRAKIF